MNPSVEIQASTSVVKASRRPQLQCSIPALAHLNPIQSNEQPRATSKQRLCVTCNCLPDVPSRTRKGKRNPKANICTVIRSPKKNRARRRAERSAHTLAHTRMPHPRSKERAQGPSGNSTCRAVRSPELMDVWNLVERASLGHGIRFANFRLRVSEAAGRKKVAEGRDDDRGKGTTEFQYSDPAAISS